MPVAGRKKRIRNPDDKDNYVDVSTTEMLYMKTGSGGTFQRSKREFLNDDLQHDTTRIVIVKRIEHQALLPNGDPDPNDVDDPTQYVMFEQIFDLVMKTGSGETYNKFTYEFKSDRGKDKKDGDSHTKRIYHKDDDGVEDFDTWLDIERFDKLYITTGSGETFQRYIYEFNWKDDEEKFDDYTDNLDLDDPDDPDKGFDPPWRLDFLQNIVNVQWSTYRLTGFFQSQDGATPAWSIQFVAPRPYYTLGELNKLAADGQKTNVPAFGARIGVPTESPPGFPDVINPPTGDPDYRGYTTLTGAAGTKVYFDYKGQSIAASAIPKLTSVKGSAIASDALGTVYFLNASAEPSEVRGLTKYGPNGDVLWRVNEEPETVFYDKDAGKIYLIYSRVPGEDSGGAQIYSTNGVLLDHWTLPSDYDFLDCTRNGTIFATPSTTPLDAVNWASIFGYSRSGTQLWEAPGELVAGGYFQGGATAYGEDYLIVVYVLLDQFVSEIDTVTDPGTDAIPPTIQHAITLANYSKYKVHDARTGAVLAEVATGTDEWITKDKGDVFGDPPPPDDHFQYGHSNGFVRSEYWPSSPP